MSRGADIAIIGAGLVGSALALGLTRHGAQVALFDAGGDDFHASAGNFGLVWVQGKGIEAPVYADLTRRSVALWPAFQAELAEATGHDPAYRRSGGLKIALSDGEFATQTDTLARLHNQRAALNTELMDGDSLRAMIPALGPEVRGGTFCAEDGHADPLATHAALRRATQRAIIRAHIHRIEPTARGFTLHSETGTYEATRVVIAAGLASDALGAPLGLSAHLRPQRGQILVTQRMERFLDLACHTVRQTTQGTVMMGDTKEDVGYDRGTTPMAARAMVARAVRMFPHLADARIVRQWGALRVMSPDGLPVYAQSETHPGAYLVTCHSGVTLAAVHARDVADAIATDRLTDTWPELNQTRLKGAAA
ncbi:NAD(P)/FAD-dependent oxidoreductase [Oceaniglobus ichthyenteri]|uniref:NAD(P)/FAD-dependent oxidoreductase n=1 Tax=Oceaniglobus ichthyenteri TaxID=2136177 RepID=UPI000D33D384|nr:FAD-dependent oxidoreductase [Oceaniglobus ichthyenteri]